MGGNSYYRQAVHKYLISGSNNVWSLINLMAGFMSESVIVEFVDHCSEAPQAKDIWMFDIGDQNSIMVARLLLLFIKVDID